MPRFAINDYIFYKLACLDNSVDLCYTGSTANWKQRKQSHKSDCNNENGKKYNLKVYTLIRENGGWDNFKMIEIGKQEQITLRQAEYIEEQYRVELNATMNGRSCFRTEEEKQEYNKERCKKWYENNKEHQKEHMKNWHKNNPEHIKAYAQTAEAKAKQAIASKKWRENNPDYNKKYAQTETAKANRQTPEAKALNNARSKKYYAKKKLEKTETAL